MNSIPLFPCISLAFKELCREPKPGSHPPLPHMMQINYCREGRLGLGLGQGNTVYLGPQDYSLHTMDACTSSVITLPGGSYSGLSLYVDLELLTKQPPEILADTGITGELLRQKFCRDGACASLAGNVESESVFSAFFHQPEQLKKACWQLKSLELLIYLAKLDFSPKKRLSEYQSEQVEIVRAIHEYLVEHLDERFTIESLARQFLMNPTTLKSVFKAVYGSSLAAHIKKHRMELAARLLLDTRDPVVHIAKAVGYDTQSKFTAAFKDYFHLLPTEYRKSRLQP